LKIFQFFLVAYAFFYFLNRYFKFGFGVFLSTTVFMSGFVLYLARLDFDESIVRFSAGRVLIWSLTLEHYLADFDFVNFLLGYDHNPLSRSYMWDADEFYSAHNHYLFLMLNGGALFSFAFIYVLKIVFSKVSELGLIIIVLSMTLAFTGDLFSYLSAWVILCYCIVFKWQMSNEKLGNA
jgi:hypothetical protein